MWVLIATSIAMLSVMALALARALKAETVYDRILGVNMFGTKTALFIAVLGFLGGRPDFLDIAIVYALINFIGMIAVLRFFEYTASNESDDPEESIK
ncbi:monovalent cation/H+ antiporter complex subunit F [Psychrobium sp. nBUS_13]|uniref:monovalent cation/H+ antiporter complex subunit F n=1 Tax=Psychrobium sp. nBUS_13 TaxID=3395319 RepID=UPI003EBD1F7A